jgi:two-component system, NarL family, nitrate/nitrite response regulator NarL
MRHRYRVAVVDDQPLFRHGILHTLAEQHDMVVVQQGATTEDAIRIAREYLPDVIVLGLNIPGDGFTAIGAIALHPTVSVLVLTAIADAECVATAMRQGARGCLLKGTSGQELVATLRALAQGGSYVSPNVAGQPMRGVEARPQSRAVSRSQLPALSPREAQILSLLSRGLSNKEIGLRLGLAEKTVKHYITIVLKKRHARNRVQAALSEFHRISGNPGAAEPPRRYLVGLESTHTGRIYATKDRDVLALGQCQERSEMLQLGESS